MASSFHVDPRTVTLFDFPVDDFAPVQLFTSCESLTFRDCHGSYPSLSLWILDYTTCTKTCIKFSNIGIFSLCKLQTVHKWIFFWVTYPQWSTFRWESATKRSKWKFQLKKYVLFFTSWFSPLGSSFLFAKCSFLSAQHNLYSISFILVYNMTILQSITCTIHAVKVIPPIISESSKNILAQTWKPLGHGMS